MRGIIRRWHPWPDFLKARASNQPVNNYGRGEDDYYPCWDNRWSLLKASASACRHKYFLITKAETHTRCAVPKYPRRTQARYSTAPKMLWLFAITVKMCWQGFSWKELAFGEGPVGVSSEGCWAPHRIPNITLNYVNSSKAPRKTISRKFAKKS